MIYETKHALEWEGKLLPVFPCLMPATWDHAPTQLCEPIVRGVRLPHVPLVAPINVIGDPDHGEFRRVFGRTERLEAAGWSYPEYVAESLENLRRYPATWARQGGGPGYLMGYGRFLSAEKLLDREFMRQAARQLGAPGADLIATIPARGYLCASLLSDCVDSPKDVALIRGNAECVLSPHGIAFGGIAKQMFERAGDAAITPWAFLVVDGLTNVILERL